MSSSSVKSAERLLDVLELLARHTRPVPTMAIARECGIPKSSTHHLLNVARDRGFVTYYEAERAWGLGVAAFEIGSAYVRSGPLQRLAHPQLVELSRRSGEAAHLAVLHGTEVLYLDMEQPAAMPVRLVTEVGVRLPAHLTAVGRAILGHLPEAQLRALFDRAPLVQRTDRGPVDVDALLRGLAPVRAGGVARDEGMTTPGISCVAAPVFGHDGQPVAALGVTFVTAGRTPEGIGEAEALVAAHAARVSAAMGWRAAEAAA
jgi:IclR family transcriptional regulator, acetate operon repressor